MSYFLGSLLALIFCIGMAFYTGEIVIMTNKNPVKVREINIGRVQVCRERDGFVGVCQFTTKNGARFCTDIKNNLVDCKSFDIMGK